MKRKQYRAERYDFKGWFVEGYKEMMNNMVVIVDDCNRIFYIKPKTLKTIKR